MIRVKWSCFVTFSLPLGGGIVRTRQRRKFKSQTCGPLTSSHGCSRWRRQHCAPPSPSREARQGGEWTPSSPTIGLMRYPLTYVGSYVVSTYCIRWSFCKDKFSWICVLKKPGKTTISWVFNSAAEGWFVECTKLGHLEKFSMYVYSAYACMSKFL